MKAARHLAYGLVKGIAPVALWRLLAWRKGYPEPEMRLMRTLVRSGTAVIDVGASGGQYALHLAALGVASLLFEPRAAAAAELRRRFLGGAWLHRCVGSAPYIRIEQVALSEQPGTATLRLLPSDVGRSTLEAGNPIEQRGQVESVEVPVRRLDDYLDSEPLCSRPVSFIKVDVEGHEVSVLRGALGLLQRDRPSLLVEVEEEHRSGSLAEVRDLLAGLGYRGSFLWQGESLPLDAFDSAIHAVPNTGRRDAYVNNFLFQQVD